MRGIVKQYPLVRAIDGADFTVEQGEIHSLLGENGAGKSTLMKILYGMTTPTAGEVRVFGKPVAITRPAQAIALGIGMVHQHFMLTPVMTVAENVVIGSEPVRGVFFDRKKAEAQVAAMIDEYNFHISATAKVETLSVGEQQRVEILKALYRGADLLILDEPTAVLTPQEVEDLFRVMRQLKAAGKSIIIITHKLKETMEIADRVSVLRQGKMIESGVPVAGTTMNELAQMMVGRDVELSVTRRAEQVGEENFSVRGLSLTERGVPILRDVCLSLRKGEILGIAGIEGNGQTELIEVLTGLRRPDHMELFKDGKPLSGNAAAFLAAGVGHVPEDRMTRGLVLEMSIEDNLILGYHRRPAFARRGLRLASAIRRFAEQERTEFAIKAPNVQERCSALSGGNQQKVVIARVFSENRGPAHPWRGRGRHGVHSPPPVGSAGRRQVHPAHLRRSGRGAQPVRPSGGHLRRPDRGRGQAGHLERHGDRPADDRRQPCAGKGGNRMKKRALSGLLKLDGPLLSILSLLIAIVISGVIMAVCSYNPIEAFGAILAGSFGSQRAIVQTLTQATPLIFTGLAFAFAKKASLINLGAEGQLYMGALASAAVGMLDLGLPMALHLPLAVAAGMAAGGLYAGLVGVLKVKFGSNEVIATVMLNSIATYLVDYLLNGPMLAENSSVAQTERVLETAQLPRIFQQYQLTIAILLAVAACILVKLFMDRTALGYEIRAVGLNPDAAETAGISKAKVTIVALCISGCIAGLAGASHVLGVDRRLINGFSNDYGFSGISVAALAADSPVGVIFAGIVFGALRAGTMELNRTTSIPVEFVNVIQAMVVILVAAPLLVKELKRLNPAGWSRKTKKEVA